MSIDFKKVYKELYKASGSGFSLVQVPTLQYLMLDGFGNPNSNDFSTAVEAMYAVAYKIRFELKKSGFIYVVPPLEGLWWMDDMAKFRLETKDEWKWTLLILQPELVDPNSLDEGILQASKKSNNPRIPEIRLGEYREGQALQTLYIGPYDQETETIRKMHDWIEEKNYKMDGKHHEIYLSDARKTDPAKLRTILRQPISLLK